MTAPLMTSMMSAMMSARSGGGTEAMQALLAQQAGDDPNAAMFMQLMAQRNETSETNASSSGEDEPAARALERARVETVARLRSVIRALQEENTRLSAQSRTVASALGACPVCWGDDALCDICGGGGTPGWRPPARGLFALYVRPALAYMQRPLPARHRELPQALETLRHARSQSDSHARPDGGTHGV